MRCGELAWAAASGLKTWLLTVCAIQPQMEQSLSHQECVEKQWQECSKFSILGPKQSECNKDRELGTTHADYHCKFGDTVGWALCPTVRNVGEELTIST